LCRYSPDLAGLKGASRKRKISMEEVVTHATEADGWTVFKGKVYNLSPYLGFHPGGKKILLSIIGKDCTAQFNKFHAWINGEFMMEKCRVGVLDTAEPGSDDEDDEDEDDDDDFSFRT
jgi:cytochrome b involved in lipid metabolism